MPVLSSTRLAVVVAGVGALGVVLVAAAVILRRDGLVALALAALGAAYALSLFLPEGLLDAWAPLVAAGLLLVAELAYWSLELTTPVRAERGIVRRRAALVAAAAVVAAPVGALVLAAATVAVAGGILWDAAGIAAAVAAVGLAAAVARGSRA